MSLISNSIRMDSAADEPQTAVVLRPSEVRAQEKQLDIKSVVGQNLAQTRKQERRKEGAQTHKLARQKRITQLRAISGQNQRNQSVLLEKNLKKERVMVVLLKKRDISTRHEGSYKDSSEKAKGKEKVESVSSKRVRSGSSAAAEASMAQVDSLDRVEQSIVALVELATKLQNDGIMNYHGLPKEWVEPRVRAFRVVVANTIGTVLTKFRENAVGDNYVFAFETAEKAINLAILKLNERGLATIEKLKQIRAQHGLGS